MTVSKRIAVLALAIAVLGVSAVATAAQPGFVFPGNCCYYDGDVVRTVVPPAAFPNEGTDPFYGITNGVTGQKAVVGLAPGDSGYNGGHWAFYSVTWTSAPFLLTSEAAVLAARSAGLLTVTRVSENDFLCPIQK
jgi:hypothetical protein